MLTCTALWWRAVARGDLVTRVLQLQRRRQLGLGGAGVGQTLGRPSAGAGQPGLPGLQRQKARHTAAALLTVSQPPPRPFSLL